MTTQLQNEPHLYVCLVQQKNQKNAAYLPAKRSEMTRTFGRAGVWIVVRL